MTHRRLHWLEKLQVQLTAAGVLVVAYFLVWRLIRPADPTGAVAFVATGALRDAGLLAAVVLVLTVVGGVTTLTARPEGAMTAVLLGLGGVSLHSGPMRTLLWVRQDDLGALYWQMAAETVLLGAILAAAAVVLHGLRRAVGGRLGRWAWRDLLGDFDERRQREYVRFVAAGKNADGADAYDDLPLKIVGGGFARIIVERWGAARRGRSGASGGDEVARRGMCFALLVAAGLALVWLLARSVDRGQVLFAVFGGCFLATMLAYMVFPMRFSLPAWAGPILVGVASYVLAATGSLESGQGAWMNVPACYQALPLDWLTGGVGGALLGYWVASRMHENKFLEYQEEQEEGA
jgi:hypothetical protein